MEKVTQTKIEFYNSKTEMEMGIRSMERSGWVVVDTEVVRGRYTFAKTCLFALIFLPLALLGRSKDQYKVHYKRVISIEEAGKENMLAHQGSNATTVEKAAELREIFQEKKEGKTVNYHVAKSIMWSSVIICLILLPFTLGFSLIPLIIMVVVINKNNVYLREKGIITADLKTYIPYEEISSVEMKNLFLDDLFHVASVVVKTNTGKILQLKHMQDAEKLKTDLESKMHVSQ